jgi:small-conductance mechanosensitive channel
MISEMTLHTQRLEETSAAMLGLKNELTQSTVKCRELEMALQSSQILNQALADENEHLEAQLLKVNEQYHRTWKYKIQNMMKKT